MLAMTQTPPTTTAETGRDSRWREIWITSEPSKSSPSRCHGRMSTSRAYKAWLRCKSMIWKRSANRHGRCRRHRGFKQQIELSPKRKAAFDLWNAFRCTAQSFTQVVSSSPLFPVYPMDARDSRRRRSLRAKRAVNCFSHQVRFWRY
ncbi:hypothetical protein GQ600_764 [Phytophthora cactorum]|nr:hypothetical protein GQ600_764 [Phytophthora cactorum]